MTKWLKISQVLFMSGPRIWDVSSKLLSQYLFSFIPFYLTVIECKIAWVLWLKRKNNENKMKEMPSSVVAKVFQDFSANKFQSKLTSAQTWCLGWVTLLLLACQNSSICRKNAHFQLKRVNSCGKCFTSFFLSLCCPSLRTRIAFGKTLRRTFPNFFSDVILLITFNMNIFHLEGWQYQLTFY